MHALGADRPTVLGALKALGDEVVAIGTASAPQYTLRDPLRADLEVLVHAVTAEGQRQALGALVPVCPQGFVMAQADGQRLYSDSLPWWLFDIRPQGYLGRAYNRHHGARLGLPTHLEEWSDRHILQTLLQQGEDLPGHLLLGDASHDRFIHAPAPVPITAARPQAYADLAAAAERGELPGPLVGGEQPKFTAFVQSESESAAHVIVKFSASVDNPTSQRWRDLLLAEHTALQVLNDGGIVAARSNLIDHGVQRFLEVQRFDRVGALGRRALHSLAALDAEFAGNGGRWPEVASALARERIISPEAVKGACLLWAFGTLIGNTDMHAGNLSFLSEHGRLYRLAPAYDMTPMAFAPTATGELPERLLALHVGEQVPARTWLQALPLAQEFVQRLQAAGGLSPGFAPCMAALKQHVALAAVQIGRPVG